MLPSLIHMQAMPKPATLTRIGSKIKVSLERVKDRIPTNLISQLESDPRGTVRDYKMTDGKGIGVVLEFSNGQKNWFFEDEII
tara:strand:+ start:975 stop:1223 length:249 start_codon:yes stop_codon:yes gene_type:complete